MTAVKKAKKAKRAKRAAKKPAATARAAKSGRRAASLEARVVELEVRDMQKQKTLDDLAELVWEKEQRLAKLEKQLEMLKTQVLLGREEDATDEPPPHY